MVKVPFSSRFSLFPSSSFLRAIIIVFLVLLVSILAWCSINYISDSTADCDSGIFASGGFFLLKGKILYKDFWDHKPPIVFLLNAAALSVGDISFNSIRTMERCFAVFGGVSFFFIIYLLFKNMWLSFFASVFYIMHFFRPAVFEGGNLTEEYGAVFVIGGILFAVLSNETRRFSFVSNFISGMFFSTAFFTKEPFFLSAIPWFIYVILYKDRNYINMLKRASVFIAGAFLIFAAILFYLLINDNFKDWIDILSYGRAYSSMRSGKLTMLGQILKNCRQVYERLFGVTFIAVLFALVGLVSVFRWSFVKKYKYLYLVIVSFFAMDFYATMMSSRGFGHYYLQSVASYILVSAMGVEFFLNTLKKSRLIQAGFILAIVLLSFSVDKHAYMEYKKNLMMPAKKATCDNIVEYIKANSSEEETIWMTSTGAFPRYYMESERLSPTKYYFLSDELFVDTYLSTAEEKIISLKDDLKRNPPKFIITGFENIRIVKLAKIQNWINANYYKLPVSSGPAVLFALKSPSATIQDK